MMILRGIYRNVVNYCLVFKGGYSHVCKFEHSRIYKLIGGCETMWFRGWEGLSLNFLSFI